MVAIVHRCDRCGQIIEDDEKPGYKVSLRSGSLGEPYFFDLCIACANKLFFKKEEEEHE